MLREHVPDDYFFQSAINLSKSPHDLAVSQRPLMWAASGKEQLHVRKSMRRLKQSMVNMRILMYLLLSPPCWLQLLSLYHSPPCSGRQFLFSIAQRIPLIAWWHVKTWYFSFSTSYVTEYSRDIPAYPPTSQERLAPRTRLVVFKPWIFTFFRIYFFMRDRRQNSTCWN